ncbi:hypothetical protein BpHYR1_054129 [Brachionus plicatilis]|uniref:Uncharacterized protein n=1 Tax=Brachionus plicatilis TaxID=10195 RepID=A0A3M7SMS6_BRAPC|nr:hypothetical protein BpHYR1_054129 [Brachionus plicatilis]
MSEQHEFFAVPVITLTLMKFEKTVLIYKKLLMPSKPPLINNRYDTISVACQCIYTISIF